MGYVIAIIAVVFLFSSPKKLIGQVFKIFVFGALIWLAFQYTAIFFGAIGALIFLGLAVDFYSGLKLRGAINREIKNNNTSGVVDIFIQKTNDDKKKILKFILNKENGNLSAAIFDEIFIKDFFCYAQKSGKGDVLLFEKDAYVEYVEKIWSKDKFKSFDLSKVREELHIFFPEWAVSIETPLDQKSGKPIDLIKLAKLGGESLMEIDLDGIV